MNAMWVTKFFYLLLAGIAYLFFCLYLPQFSAYLLLSILLLPLGFFLAAHLCGRKLQAEISLSERETHLQESCCCTVSLKNPTWLPIGTVTFFLSVENTTLHLGNQQEMQTSIAPRDTMQLEIPLVPSHCGQVRVTLHQCRIYDGIHLFSHRKRLNTSAVFTVLPGVPAPPVTDAGTQYGDAAVMQPTTEPEEFLGVRDYRSGDRMRAIHWKLSSRFPEPVVREYGIPQKAPVAVGFLYALPDGMQDPGSSLDAMLEALLAAVSYFCENGDCVTVILCRVDQRRSETLTAANDLLPMLETLLESPPDTDAAGCLSILEESGDKITCCICGGGVRDIPAETVFTAAAGVPGQTTIAAGTAAKTVYQKLSDTEGGAL